MKKGYALSRACPQASVFVFKFQISKFLFVALQLALYPVGFFFRLSLACEKFVFFFFGAFSCFHSIVRVFFWPAKWTCCVAGWCVRIYIILWFTYFFFQLPGAFWFFLDFFLSTCTYAPRIFRVFVIRFPILCLCLHVSAQHFFFSLSFSTHMSHHHTHMSHHHTCFCPTLFLLSLFL